MLEKTIRTATALSFAFGMAFAISSAPAMAEGESCEEDPYCHEDMKRDLGEEACEVWGCDSEMYICCIILD